MPMNRRLTAVALRHIWEASDTDAGPQARISDSNPAPLWEQAEKLGGGGGI